MATNTDDAEEQALAALCGSDHPWTWGSNEATCMISFERNGTGQLDIGEGQRSWVALEFAWSLTSKPVKSNNNAWNIAIQMTLSTRLNSSYHKESPWLKDAELKDHLQNPPSPSKAPFPWAPLRPATFRPKQFTLTLSRGRFIEPFHNFIKKPYPLFQSAGNNFAPNRYTSKLTFDTSPFPPREEWVGEGHLRASLDYHRHWEKRELVRGLIAKKDETWRETLDWGWWLSSSSGDANTRG